tara:strand:+ start:319 stop:528 length:210 start_codon:yes stop_codon:yes gene_type:complete
MDSRYSTPQQLKDKQHKSSIQRLKETFSLNNEKIAKMFGMSKGSYENSTAKKRYEKALIAFNELTTKTK